MATPEPETPAQQAASAFHPITADGVKSRLIGLEGWLKAAAACERRYNDDKIGDTAQDKVSDLQGRLQMQILPVQVCMANDGQYSASLPAGMDLDVRLPLPYYRDEAEQFFRVTLPHHPVREVQRLRLMLGNQVAYIVPTDWFSLDPDTGEFHLLPMTGSLQSVAGSWFAAAVMASFSQGRMPATIAFDYVAGMPDGWMLQNRWRALRRTLEEHAAHGVLTDIAHLYDAGLMNRQISQFGLSQTLNYTRFNDRKQELEQSVQAFVDDFKPRNTPVVFTSL